MLGTKAVEPPSNSGGNQRP